MSMSSMPSLSPPVRVFDAEIIRVRLATRPSSVPDILGDDGVWKSYSRRQELTPAAVLVPIVARADGPTVLLTQRTAHLNDHASQISFPGGRIETYDESIEHAALREVEEEIGLPRAYVELLGRLPEYITVSGFRVTPVVGWVRTGFELTLDKFEVAEAFEVPLAFFLDAANHQRTTITLLGKERSFYVMPYRERNVWGATAGMLHSLYQVLTSDRQSGS